jgi:FMN phosphatase YigB (HAD superfamily)
MIIEEHKGQFDGVPAEELLRRDLPRLDDWPMSADTEEDLRERGILTNRNHPKNQEQLRTLLRRAGLLD